MIASDSFGVVVVDLHMPRMSGLEFCRAVREMDVAGDGRVGVISIDGSDGGEGATVVSADRAKLLLHTTAAGSVKSDELQVTYGRMCREGMRPAHLSILRIDP